MGLDMYLYLRKYENCSRWNNNYEQKKDGFYPQELKAFADEISNRDSMSKITVYQVGYWRKAIAINRWFFNVCAKDNYDCQMLYVSIGRAKELRNLCNRVLEKHELAPSLLPVSDGVSFESQEYDDWYFNNIEYTKELLDKIIAFIDENGGYDIIYEASW